MAHTKRTMKPATRRNIAGYMFILPGLLGVLIFCLFPMIYSFIMGFTNWNMKSAPSFVGIDNFASMANDPIVWKSVQVTLYYTVLAVPLTNIVALCMASAAAASALACFTFLPALHRGTFTPRVTP